MREQGELMNKQGHLFMTGKMMPKDYIPYRRWLLFGSILPDLLFHTFLAGHTWDAMYEKTIRGMEELERWGEMNRCSCLCLGFYLHYVEDYFTLPHNQNFSGGFTAHVLYEKRFTQYLMRAKEADKTQQDHEWKVSSFRELQAKIESLHTEYILNKKSGFVNDEKYISKAVYCVLDYFALVLVRNRQVLDTARLEALCIAQEGWLSAGRVEV